MRQRIVQFFWISLLLLITLYAIALAFFKPAAYSLAMSLPTGRISQELSGLQLSPTVDEQQFYGDGILFKCLYSTARNSYTLYIIQPHSKRTVVHDPAYCFMGAGWKIVDQQSFPLPHGEAKAVRLSTKTAGSGTAHRTSSILYWFSDGKEQWTSTYRFWFQFMIWRLSFGYIGIPPRFIFLQTPGETPQWEVLVEQLPELVLL